MRRMLNGYHLIKPINSKTTLGNGIAVTEERDRKSIVRGEIIAGQISLGIAYYPAYAAETIELDEGVFHIVSMDDIVMIDSEEEVDTDANSKSKTNS